MAASTAPALPEQAGLNSLPSSLPRIDVRGDSPAADQPRIRRSITLDSTPAKQKMAKVQLRSCGVAQRHLLPGVEHRQSRYLNNRAENSHRPTRRRERLQTSLDVATDRLAIEATPPGNLRDRE